MAAIAVTSPASAIATDELDATSEIEVDSDDFDQPWHGIQLKSKTGKYSLQVMEMAAKPQPLIPQAGGQSASEKPLSTPTTSTTHVKAIYTTLQPELTPSTRLIKLSTPISTCIFLMNTLPSYSATSSTANAYSISTYSGAGTRLRLCQHLFLPSAEANSLSMLTQLLHLCLSIQPLLTTSGIASGTQLSFGSFGPSSSTSASASNLESMPTGISELKIATSKPTGLEEAKSNQENYTSSCASMEPSYSTPQK